MQYMTDQYSFQPQITEDGNKIVDLVEIFGLFWKHLYENPQLCLPPEGETFSKVQERAVKALQDILLGEGEDKDIAVISHGGVIRTQICALLDVPLANFWRINVHNASTTCFTVWDGNFTADIINDHHYL